MIRGVVAEKRKVIANPQGDILHMLRADSPLFSTFGEIYFSFCKPGVIKGWKKHALQTQHFVVPVGHLKLVLYDAREDSSTREEIAEYELSRDNYLLVRIPPEIWYSFTAVGEEAAMIANCTDIPHHPDESSVLAIGEADFPYRWQAHESAAEDNK